MRYVVLLESRAEKELKALPKQALKRIDIKLQAFIKLMIKKILSVFIELNIGGKLIASLACNISRCLLLLY